RNVDFGLGLNRHRRWGVGIFEGKILEILPENLHRRLRLGASRGPAWHRRAADRRVGPVRLRISLDFVVLGHLDPPFSSPGRALKPGRKVANTADRGPQWPHAQPASNSSV